MYIILYPSICCNLFLCIFHLPPICHYIWCLFHMAQLIKRVYIYIYILVGGFNPCLKKKSQLGWFSQYMESHKIHVPNHQPVHRLYLLSGMHIEGWDDENAGISSSKCFMGRVIFLRKILCFLGEHLTPHLNLTWNVNCSATKICHVTLWLWIIMEAIAHRNRCVMMIYLLKILMFHSYAKLPNGFCFESG